MENSSLPTAKAFQEKGTVAKIKDTFQLRRGFIYLPRSWALNRSFKVSLSTLKCRLVPGNSTQLSQCWQKHWCSYWNSPWYSACFQAYISTWIGLKDVAFAQFHALEFSRVVLSIQVIIDICRNLSPLIQGSTHGRTNLRPSTERVSDLTGITAH